MIFKRIKKTEEETSRQHRDEAEVSEALAYLAEVEGTIKNKKREKEE